MPILSHKVDQARAYIPNLRLVSDNLVRGGQPEPDGLKILQAAGVRHIVNLRSTESGLVSLFRRPSAASCDPEIENEKRMARELAMSYTQIALDVFGHPSDAHLEEFLSLVADRDEGPFFVHCLHGRDRTGLLVAVYRVVIDSWAAEKAYGEMIECGFDTDRTNLSDALFAYAKKHAARL